MSAITKWIRKTFGGGRLRKRRLATMPVSEVFNSIYEENSWKGDESISGTGSNLEQTSHISTRLPVIMQQLGAKSLLDIPCGDFYWMQHVEFGEITYIGADIVEELVSQNRAHENEGRSFVHCNLLTDKLPEVDVIFCRDCMVHFSEQHIWQALENISRSKAKYLITTTFTQRTNDKKIETGQWRPLNLQAEPFLLPETVQLIDEKCTQDDGAYPDKMLGVWSIDAIRSVISRSKVAA